MQKNMVNDNDTQQAYDICIEGNRKTRYWTETLMRLKEATKQIH